MKKYLNKSTCSVAGHGSIQCLGSFRLKCHRYLQRAEGCTSAQHLVNSLVTLMQEDVLQLSEFVLGWFVFRFCFQFEGNYPPMQKDVTAKNQQQHL